MSADGRNTWMMTILHGLGWTLATALCAGIIAFFLGSALGVMRTTPNKWAVRLGNAYVEFFRNIPLLVQLFLWFFVLPELLPKAMGTAIKQMTPPWASFVPAVIGLGLFTAARVSEQVRAGIQALPRGQGMAGTALGLTLPQTLSLRAAADGVPDHHAAAHVGDDEPHQEHVGGVDDRPGRAHGGGAVGPGVHVPGFRSVHRGDGDLHRRQPHRRQPDALAGEAALSVPGFIGPQVAEGAH